MDVIGIGIVEIVFHKWNWLERFSRYCSVNSILLDPWLALRSLAQLAFKGRADWHNQAIWCWKHRLLWGDRVHHCFTSSKPNFKRGGLHLHCVAEQSGSRHLCALTCHINVNHWEQCAAVNSENQSTFSNKFKIWWKQSKINQFLRVIWITSGWIIPCSVNMPRNQIPTKLHELVENFNLKSIFILLNVQWTPCPPWFWKQNAAERSGLPVSPQQSTIKKI